MKSRYLLLGLLFAFLMLASTKTGDILREADFYTKLAKNYIRCDLCPNNCVLKDGETGNTSTSYLSISIQIKFGVRA